MFLKNKNIIFEIRRSKVTDYAALTSPPLDPPMNALWHASPPERLLVNVAYVVDKLCSRAARKSVLLVC